MSTESQNKRKEFIRVLMFTIVSISAAIIQLGSFALFNELFKWTYWVSYIISLLLSVIWNFTINRKVTFKYAVFTPASTILGNMAAKNNVNEYIIEIASMLSNFVLEFLYTRFVVYRKTCDTLTKKKK